MKRYASACAVLAVVFAAAVTAYAQSTPEPPRAVAITIDDLPAASNGLQAAAVTELTTKLLTTLRDQKVPAIGFVNEKKLYRPGEADVRIAALKMWLDYGFELGNHTFAHTSLNNVPLAQWEEDVVRGETVTTLLMNEKKMKLRYFRHPFLDTGRDLQTRRDAEAFLVGRGYRIAPVTVDGWDWMYAGVYEDAKKRGDTALQQQLVQSYLQHCDEMFAYSEKVGKQLVGYEPRQIMLMHANQLEADHIGELIEVLRKRGYKFITLAEALSDPMYSLPDTFVADDGYGWLDHWAISQGKILQGLPQFPQWVIDKAKQLPTQGTW